jgi:hypothetical protein
LRSSLGVSGCSSSLFRDLLSLEIRNEAADDNNSDNNNNNSGGSDNSLLVGDTKESLVVLP